LNLEFGFLELPVSILVLTVELIFHNLLNLNT